MRCVQALIHHQIIPHQRLPGILTDTDALIKCSVLLIIRRAAIIIDHGPGVPVAENPLPFLTAVSHLMKLPGQADQQQ